MKYSDLKKLDKKEIITIIEKLVNIKINIDYPFIKLYWINDNLNISNISNNKIYLNDIPIYLNNIHLIQYKNSIIILNNYIKRLETTLMCFGRVFNIIIINSDNSNLSLEDIKTIIDLNKEL